MTPSSGAISWLARHARERPERVALECDGERLSYAELHARAAATPAPEVIELPAGVEFAVALHSCLLHGVPAVPIDLRLPEADRALRRRAAGTAGAALVVHTSGTTAAPKPVALTPANIRANAVGSALALGLDLHERWLCPLPLTHVGGLMVLLRSLYYGTTAVLGPIDRIEEVTLVSLVPTQLARVLDAGLERPARLRCALIGGGPLDPALAQRAAAAGVPVAQTYGLTEACSQVTVSEPGDPSTAGWPLPGVELELAEDGEILVSGPTVAGGGTLHTGDLGRLDERGRLTVVGRKSELIVSGGENVAPTEVEAVLLAHPAVAEAGVFGRPDPEWGEAVCAQVVLRAETPPEALRAFCRERLAGFQVPKTIEIVDVLPRTASGKLLRRVLR